jgi:hypothetical protein
VKLERGWGWQRQTAMVSPKSSEREGERGELNVLVCFNIPSFSSVCGDGPVSTCARGTVILL